MNAPKDSEKESQALQILGHHEEISPDQNPEDEKKVSVNGAEGRQLVGDSILESIARGEDDDARHQPGDDLENSSPVVDNTTDQEPISEITEKTSPVNPKDTVYGCGYPDMPDPRDPARILNRNDLRKQRLLFWGIIATINIGMTMIAIFEHTGMVVFVFILFIKSKDFLSCLVSAFGLLIRSIYRIFKPLSPVPRQWILTLIPAYSESEEQIVRTIYSLRDNDVGKHRQVMVVLLDGRPRDVRSHMTRTIRDFERPYVSLKHKRGVLKITAGFAEDVPVIIIEKVKNSGKRKSDSDTAHHANHKIRKEGLPCLMP